MTTTTTMLSVMMTITKLDDDDLILGDYDDNGMRNNEDYKDEYY